jgi:hypothetical protein
MPGCFAVEQLLFEARRDPELARSLRERPGVVTKARGLDEDAAQALAEGAVDRLLALGVNPLLLYLSMIEMGMPREDYYARLGHLGKVGQ